MDALIVSYHASINASQPKVLQSSLFGVCLLPLLQRGKSDHQPGSINRYPAIKLYSAHEESRQEVIWTRHNWLAMEQDTRIIQFQDIGLAAELWGVVDVYSVLDEPFITAGITRLTGIDRYLKEGAASATQGFQRDREDCAPYTLEMVSQFLRDHCTHLGLLPPLQNIMTRSSLNPLIRSIPSGLGHVCSLDYISSHACSLTPVSHLDEDALAKEKASTSHLYVSICSLCYSIPPVHNFTMLDSARTLDYTLVVSPFEEVTLFALHTGITLQGLQFVSLLLMRRSLMSRSPVAETTNKRTGQRSLIAYCLERDTLLFSVKMALVIGTLLALINHGQALLAGHLTSDRLVSLLLTYFVPFTVAMYSQIRGKRQRDRILKELDSTALQQKIDTQLDEQSS
jgi:hypothetical protein